MANKGHSPYRKYNKKPFRYSQLYQDWRSALKNGRTEEAQRLAAAHTTYWLSRKEPV